MVRPAKSTVCLRQEGIDLVTSLSCVIPTHNRPDGLKRALASVLNQTQPPSEILVVDDVGDASTANVIASFGDSPIRIKLLNPPEGGQRSAGASRNYGASFASSEFLAFLDDDDYWDERFLEHIFAALRSSRSELAFAALVVVNSGMQLTRRVPAAGLAAKDVITCNPGVTGSNIVVAKRLFDELEGYDASLPVYNDLDFLYRCLDGGRGYVVVHAAVGFQETSGDDHLSSRGWARAAGIKRYRRKYKKNLTWSDTRRLRRDIAVASRFPGQGRVKKLAYFVATVVNSNYKDYLSHFSRLAERKPIDYK